MNSGFIGILYSKVTGIVLRAINPSPDFDEHLAWLDANKPEGTELLCIEKAKVGANHEHMPNFDFLIPYADKNHGIKLDFGKRCGVVDKDGNVVETHLTCPVLCQARLVREGKTHQVIDLHTLETGDHYDVVTKVRTRKKDRKDINE